MYPVDQEEEVEDQQTGPVDHCEREEPHQLPDRANGGESHQEEDGSSDESSDDGEEVSADVGGEPLQGGGVSLVRVQGKGHQVKSDVEQRPEQDSA